MNDKLWRLKAQAKTMTAKTMRYDEQGERGEKV
jgi:hypothetical protein